MKKKVFMILVAMMAISAAMSQNYDFSATAPSGQTIYYKINGVGEVDVTCQNDSYPYYSTFPPSGNLIIPGSVEYNGTTYTVTRIGYYAFYNCTDLTSVTIPNTVTT